MRGAVVAIAAALAIALFAFGAALADEATTSAFPEPTPMEARRRRRAPGVARGTRPRRGRQLAHDIRGRGSCAGCERSPVRAWLNGRASSARSAGAAPTTGEAVVPMNAPYDFSEYDGWVVVEEGSETPLLTT
jgi:hypothetical protein